MPFNNPEGLRAMLEALEKIKAEGDVDSITSDIGKKVKEAVNLAGFNTKELNHVINGTKGRLAKLPQAA